MTEEPVTEPRDSFIDVQEAFIEALAKVSELQPELEIRIARQIREDRKFFYATGFCANNLLDYVIQNRREAGISTNIFLHGEGGTQVGKSFSALILAFKHDPTFTIDSLFFDFTELDQKLPKTLPQTIYVVDDVRNRLGTGSKAEEIGVTNFLETSSVTGTSLFLCSPTIKTLAGIHYVIKMLGFCLDFSLGMLYDRIGDPVGWLVFIIPEELKPIIQEYKRRERAYKEGIREKSGARGGYVSGKIEQIIQDIKEKDITFETPKKLWRFIALNYDHWTQLVQRAAFDELKEIYFVEYEAPTHVIRAVAPGNLLDELISGIKSTKHRERNISIYKEAVQGRSPSWIGKKFDLTEMRIRQILGEISEQIGINFEKYLEFIQPFMWERRGGQSEPDLVNHEYRFCVSCKVMYGDQAKRRDAAITDSKPELAYQNRGYDVWLIIFWADENNFLIEKLQNFTKQNSLSIPITVPPNPPATAPPLPGQPPGTHQSTEEGGDGKEE